MARRMRREIFVIREGTGRHSRLIAEDMKACTPTQVRRLRDAALSGMVDEEWGWEIGRLFLNGRLTADQFEAGKRWRRLVTAWRQAYGLPAATTKALSLFAEPRSPSADPDSEKGRAQAERARELHLEMQTAHAVVLAYGAEHVRTLRHVVEDDCASIGVEDFNRLSSGLRALSSLWGLTAGQRS